MSLLRRAETALVVVDVQEGFRSYGAFERVARQSGRLVEGARLLEIPVIVTEQYPRGLGSTAPEVGLADDAARVEKTVFSAARADGFDLCTARQALVCGIETHVCVSQTVHDLLEQGIEVHVTADATGSRNEPDHERGLARLERAGAVVTTVEAALLELCERAGTPEFKAVQKVIM